MEKRALVTGGAQGLGREVALLLGAQGYAVDVLDREPAWESVSEGGSFYPCDLTEASGLALVRRARRSKTSTFGRSLRCRRSARRSVGRSAGEAERSKATHKHTTPLQSSDVHGVGLRRAAPRAF